MCLGIVPFLDLIELVGVSEMAFIKRIKVGEVVPFGLSKRDGFNELYFLKIPTPIFLKLTQYDVSNDEFSYGWKRFDILFKFLGKVGFVAVGKQESVNGKQTSKVRLFGENFKNALNILKRK